MYKGGLIVTNLASETFNDALFFKEQVYRTTNKFEQYKYKRASLVFFCASAEAMINALIACNLRNEKEKRNLTDNEEDIIKFLIDENGGNVPRGFSNIRNRLNRFLLESIDKPAITKSEESYHEFKRYIELSEKRNAIVHYSSNKYKDVYHNIDSWVNEAPDIIENLFGKYYELIEGTNYLYYACNEDCTKDKFLSFYKERNWKEI